MGARLDAAAISLFSSTASLLQEPWSSDAKINLRSSQT